MAISLTNKKDRFISGYIDKVTQVLLNLKDLKEARTEWDSQTYSTAIVNGDFTGTNVHLDAASLASAVTSVQAITDLLAASGNAHYTNLYKVIR